MPTYSNLPQVQINRTDGNLKVNTTSANPRVLLLGSAPKGPGDEPFEATDLSAARQVFGQTSELYQALVECRKAYGAASNIWLYRIGTTPAELQIGSSTTTSGTVKVFVRDRYSTVGNDYKASFDASSGLLWVYNEKSTLVYSNSTSNEVDLGEVEIRGDLTQVGGATDFGDPTNGTLALSVTLSGSQTSGTTFTAPTLGPTADDVRSRFEGLQNAYRLLETFKADIVVPVNTYLDAPNVAYFVSGANADAWTDKNNPVVWGTSVLGWMKETAPAQGSSTGQYTYTWATDIGTSGAIAGLNYKDNAWLTPTARIAADYHEVNFGYQLANFCYQQSKNENTAIGVIGVQRPVSTSLADIHAWIGAAPTRNQQGVVTADGYGLLGHPDIGGVTSEQINSLVKDRANGRDPGFYATASEFRDGLIETDGGGVSIDIGAYINVVGEWARHLNSTGTITGYDNSIANYYAGMIARLDERNAPTGEQAPGLRINYLAGKAKWDALTAAHIVMLQQRPEGAFVIDAPTFARETSDYRRLTTVRLVGLVEKVVRRVGNNYIGKAADAVIKASFESDIEEELQKLVKRGYLKRFEKSITTNLLQDIMGQAHISIVLVVPNELRQVFATIALGPQ